MRPKPFMSATDAPQQPHREAEPFGQMGVLQFVVPVLACASLVVMILCLFMWYRSLQTNDRLSSEQPGATWLISSNAGRLLVTAQYRPQRVEELDGTWNYASPPRRPVTPDPWADSVWKRIGVEWRARALPLRARQGTEGFWLRVRWPFLAALAGLLPVARILQVWSRRRRLAAVAFNACPECGYDLGSSRNYCPECGRPISRA